MKFLSGDFSSRHVIPLNIYYDRGVYNKFDDDIIDIVYKDLDTGKKYVESISNPKIEVWIVKPEFRTFQHIRNFIPKEQCYPIYVHYKTRFREIADELKVSVDEARVSPYVCQADIKIEHFYLMQFIIEYNTDAIKKLSIGYLDTENDIIRLHGFPNPGEAPINAVTYIDGDRKDCYTLILAKDYLPEVTPEHPDYEYVQGLKKSLYEQIDHFNVDLDEFFKTCHENFDESYGIFHFHMQLFDSEIELLNSLWTIVRDCDTDYTLVWNLPYDAMNLIERPKVLGYDPASMIVDERFGSRKREISFIEDRNPLIQKRRHMCSMYTTSTFIDQMVEYVGIRSGKGKLPSAKLNSIALSELHDEKLNYSEDTDIKHLFYHDFRKFVLYNIKDVFLQYGIEKKTKDMNTVYARLYDNFVLLNESFVTTAVVLNSVRSFAYEHGQVMGYNKNKFGANYTAGNIMDDYMRELAEENAADLAIEEGLDDEDDELDDTEDTSNDKKEREKYQGAFVMNPSHMTPTGFKIMGKDTRFVHDLMADLDIGSEQLWNPA